MSSLRPFLLIFFLLLRFVPLTESGAIAYGYCYGNVYLPTSVFETNLKVLLDYLVSHTSGPPNNDDVFYAVGDPPDRAYGQAKCNYSATMCYDCLSEVRRSLQTACEYKKGGNESNYKCFLSYHFWNIYGVPSLDPSTPPPPPVIPVLSPPPPDDADSPPPPFGVLPSPPPLAKTTPGGGGGSPRYGRSPPLTTTTERTTLSPPSPGGGEAIKLVLYVSVPLGAGLVILSVLVFFLWRKTRDASINEHVRREIVVLPPAVNPTGIGTSSLQEAEIAEATPYNLQVITRATDNFSSDNFLGEGGCGPVYKGVLPNGQGIAVKRLSGRSLLGKRQLKNEIVMVSKLQHRNLARILGYCFENNEALIMYEYFPNTSLDKFLFDPVMSQRLNWQTRFNIIKGVARGLTYLHEDSLVKIVHRDVKASNVLLDSDMNPRISDFGIAKHFKRNQTHAQTSLVIGTSAYMAPEYDIEGKYSPRSDVYGFGVLVLEIITGRRDPASHGSPELISYVSDHWWGKTTYKVLDGRAGEGYDEDEMMRCINIGLICVDTEPLKRPKMSSVLTMLASDSLTPLPPPPLLW